MADETNELITTSQVAERFRTSESTVRYWRSEDQKCHPGLPLRHEERG